MINRIKQTIHNKYYQYQRGEFLPVYSGGELLNKREFHLYKLKRAFLLAKNYRVVYHHYTQQQG